LLLLLLLLPRSSRRSSGWSQRGVIPFRRFVSILRISLKEKKEKELFVVVSYLFYFFKKEIKREGGNEEVSALSVT